jgi:outer membrane lipoprotein-sorting protein
MAASHADLETLSGTFSQRKRSELFMEDIESTGTFRCRRPDMFRYDYDPSETTGASTYWFVGDTTWVYVPELKQAEVYLNAPGQEIGNLMIGLDGAVNRLRETHWVRLMPASPEDEALGESIAHLHLVPQPGAEASQYLSADLWIDQVALLPVQLKLVEESGDETTIRIEAMNLNPSLEDTVFDPLASIPSDTEIIENN